MSTERARTEAELAELQRTHQSEQAAHNSAASALSHIHAEIEAANSGRLQAVEGTEAAHRALVEAQEARAEAESRRHSAEEELELATADRLELQKEVDSFQAMLQSEQDAHAVSLLISSISNFLDQIQTLHATLRRLEEGLEHERANKRETAAQVMKMEKELREYPEAEKELLLATQERERVEAAVRDLKNALQVRIY